ncbi:hypothetical protein, partial [Streptomyces lydicus]|uniref:hypothetical protein n=2 Tax=Streptomyces lydicus TaxID=47763 RepID=UPI001B805623
MDDPILICLAVLDPMVVVLVGLVSNVSTDEFFEPAQKNQRVEDANGPGTQKSPAPYGAGLSHNDCSAASYSPTGSPLQYHR